MADLEQNAEVSEELAPQERHRAIVRDTDKRFSGLYGYGGAAVLGAGLAVLVLFWMTTGLGHLTPWVLAFTTVLVGLGFLSRLVRRKRASLKASVEAYCKLNEINVDDLVRYYSDDGIYSYFVALFEERPK